MLELTIPKSGQLELFRLCFLLEGFRIVTRELPVLYVKGR